MFAAPLKKLDQGWINYVVAGQGAAAYLTLANLTCGRKLSAAMRAQLKRGLPLLRGLVPAGPSYCFLGVNTQAGSKALVRPEGWCDSFADAATGYGANIIDFGPELPSLAAIVPDQVATVVLRHHGRAAIRAAVHENVYWARVPLLPPPDSRAVKSSMSALRKTILHSLPTTVQWLALDGHVLHTFSLPAAYVDRLARRYLGCVATNCGA